LGWLHVTKVVTILVLGRHHFGFWLLPSWFEPIVPPTEIEHNVESNSLFIHFSVSVSFKLIYFKLRCDIPHNLLDGDAL